MENQNKVMPGQLEPVVMCKCGHPFAFHLLNGDNFYCERCTCGYFEPIINDRGVKTIKAPWTSIQVLRLSLRQMSIDKHPYTCTCGKELVATTRGWICQFCDYTQDWAIAEDAE